MADSGEIKRCNLIVSTTHNNLALNEAVFAVVQKLQSEGRLYEGSEALNLVEVAIRAYDPCLSCATHALGQMPLRIQFLKGGQVVHELQS